MENYKLLERLGRGAQGSVYLAESRADNRKYVLKKIECRDESEANKAFKEAVVLQELKHPNICNYHEFFVMWDKDERAMFVCIVMDYYESGDLDRVLRTRRPQKQQIDEVVLKKWLGQMLDALLFVHGKKVIHRDLKPSNVFLQEDLSIALGDFGVATIIGDCRTRTRTAVGSMNWMAPEVLERPYDERSDVWSLGCILLELCTCSILEQSQVSALLCEIKHEPQALEDELLKIGQIYSAELVGLVRSMLRRNFQQRPTVRELVEVPYVKDCLALTGSEIAKQKQLLKEEADRKPVPTEEGCGGLIHYLSRNLSNEVCLQRALIALGEAALESPVIVDEEGKKVIAKAMRQAIESEPAQIAGCKVLNNVVSNAEADDVLYMPEVIQVIPLAMRAHPGSLNLQLAALSLLVALSADAHDIVSASKNAAQILGDSGGVQDVLSAMRAFPKSSKLATLACTALWSLAVNENVAKIVTEEKGLADVCKALKEHVTVADVAESGSAAVLSLAMEDENLDQVNQYDCVNLLLRVLELHASDPRAVKNACMALAALVEPLEECAYRVLAGEWNGQKVEGLLLLMEAYEKHRDNAEVVESVCTVLLELAEYDEINSEMRNIRILEQVCRPIQKRFKDNKDILEPCQAAITKLTEPLAKVSVK